MLNKNGCGKVVGNNGCRIMPKTKILCKKESHKTPVFE